MIPKAGENISSSNFGAWLVKCNPREWDLASALEDGLPEIVQWSVADNYRSKSMESGDDIVFWVSGTSTKGLRAGVWGVGKVTSERYWVNDQLDPEDSYYLDHEKGSQSGYSINTDIRLIMDQEFRERVSRVALMGLKEFDSLEVLRQPQGSNPSFLTKPEFKALEKLLNRKSSRATKKTSAVTVSNGGAGFGNSEQNALVEASAIRLVMQTLKQSKFKVVDVSSEKVGWDITATKSKSQEVRHIEVKGVSGDSPKILLTSNEMKKAKSDSNWELAIVTSALSEKPFLHTFSAESVVAAGRPWLWQVDLG